jgi:hypothetical protein
MDCSEDERDHADLDSGKQGREQRLLEVEVLVNPGDA